MNARWRLLGWGGSVVLHAAVAVPLFMAHSEPPPPPAEVPLEVTVAAEDPAPPSESQEDAPAQPVAEAVTPTPPQPVQASQPPPPVQAAEPPPVQPTEPPPVMAAAEPPPVAATEPPPPEPAPEPPPELAEALPEPPPPAPPPPPVPRPPQPRPTPPRPTPPRPQVARPVERADPNLQAYAAPPAPVAPAAPAAPAAPSRPRMASAGPPANWAQRLSAAVNRAKRYPPFALQRSQEGVVYVTFRMRRDGSLISASVGRSSGNEMLDEAGLEAVQRASLPPIPEEFSDDVFSATVPINFNISGR
ncbi:energy transducer TonB [Roseomonas elaeocarpi]|uniref:Energy transducer TonB n=1 Tax=Roseomonas elaeocarpi TaxID=907779 RepID=A0ABV6JT60_9PROT